MNILNLLNDWVHLRMHYDVTYYLFQLVTGVIKHKLFFALLIMLELFFFCCFLGFYTRCARLFFSRDFGQSYVCQYRVQSSWSGESSYFIHFN